MYLYMYLLNLKTTVLNSGMFEKCAKFQDKKKSFLDAATAVPDIDTFLQLKVDQ